MHITRKKILVPAISSVLFALNQAAAIAQPTPQVEHQATTPSETPFVDTFGARVGGYGFRMQDMSGQATWDDCRMNGFGVFATKDWTTHVFTEAGADLYFTDTFPAHHATGAGGMNRFSGLFSIAAGLRMFPESLISANAHAGIGLELTKITMGEAADSFALPVGFLGIGGDIRLLHGLRFGMSLRTLVMGHPAHGAGHHHHAMLTAGESGVQVEPEVAAQAQFYLSYSL